jgi:hypothetical protein
MSYQNISSIPIQDFSDIASNMTNFQTSNIRIQKQKERQQYESRLQERQDELLNNPNNEDRNNIVEKLRKTLSKKYDLTLNDYIILIDKFKLTSTDLKRDTIISLLKYLNTKSIYTETNESIEIDSVKIKSSKIDKIDQHDFDENLKKMEEDRNNYIQKMLNSSKVESKVDNSSNSIPNINTGLSVPKYDATIFDLPNDEQSDIKHSVNNDRANIALTIRDKINNSPDNSEIINNNDQFSINPLITDNTDNDTSIVSIKEDILMLNLLKNEINGNYIVSINYKGSNKIENIRKVEFIACFMGKTLVEKNNQIKNHSIIFKIDEFQNNIYINGSESKGFCQCFLEKKSNYYTYTNEDKIFGVYTPDEPITLEKLHISIYDNLGSTINNIKYTENDQLTLVLKFFIEES